jgi:hypothetical protein
MRNSRHISKEFDYIHDINKLFAAWKSCLNSKSRSQIQYDYNILTEYVIR